MQMTTFTAVNHRLAYRTLCYLNLFVLQRLSACMHSLALVSPWLAVQAGGEGGSWNKGVVLE